MEKSPKAPRKYYVITEGELEAVALQAAEIVRRALEAEYKRIPWPERYFTKKQVCELFQISAVTLWHWDKADILKPIKIGGLIRYRKADIERITAQ